jgi:hypothetical protein
MGTAVPTGGPSNDHWFVLKSAIIDHNGAEIAAMQDMRPHERERVQQRVRAIRTLGGRL